MAIKIINVGTGPNTKNGDSLRTAFVKINENFSELYTIMEALSSGSGLPGVLRADVKGNVYAQDGELLIDSVEKTMSTSLIPDSVPIVHTFRVIFGTDGSLVAPADLPLNWTFAQTGNNLTINHTVGRRPQIVAYWGFTLSTNQYRLRYPTAGYQVKIEPGASWPFSLNLNSAVTGADNGEHALVTVQF